MKINPNAILFLFILFSHTNLHGQKLSFLGSFNNTIYHDYQSNTGHYRSSYVPGLGYSVGIQLDSIQSYWWNIPVTLQFERYGASLGAQGGGLAGGYDVEAAVDKSVISLGIIPLNFSIKSKLKLSFGLNLSLLLDERVKGTYQYWRLGQPSINTNVKNYYARYSRTNYVGIMGGVTYDLFFTKSLVFSPQYRYYFGLSNEFQGFPYTTKAMRHEIGIWLRNRGKWIRRKKTVF